MASFARLARSLQTSDSRRPCFDSTAVPNNTAFVGLGRTVESKPSHVNPAAPLVPAQRDSKETPSSSIGKQFVQHQPVQYSTVCIRKCSAHLKRYRDQKNSLSCEDDIKADSAQFLLIGAHKYAASFPNLSRHFLRQAAISFNEAHIDADSKVKKNICGFCGAIFVPGISCTIRLHSRKSQSQQGFDECTEESDHILEQKRDIGEYLVYLCSCGNTTAGNKISRGQSKTGTSDTVIPANTVVSSKRRKGETSLQKAVAKSHAKNAAKKASPLGLFVIDPFGDSSFN